MNGYRTTTTGGRSYPCWKCGGQVLDGCTHYCHTAALPAKTLIFGDARPQPPQRQDSLDAQMRDVMRLAVEAGCYDAHDWLLRHYQRVAER